MFISDELQAQSGFACRIGQCRDSTVVLTMSTIEFDLFDPRFESPFCQDFTDGGGRFRVPTRASGKLLFQTASSRDGLTRLIVNQLAADVFQAPRDRQAWSVRRPFGFIPYMPTTTSSCLVQIFFFIHGVISNRTLPS